MSERRNPAMSAEEMRQRVTTDPTMREIPVDELGRLRAERDTLSRLLREAARQTVGNRVEARSWRDHLIETQAELERLRARDEAAEAVMQAWTDLRTQGLDGAAVFSVRFRALLDALVRAHEDGGTVR